MNRSVVTNYMRVGRTASAVFGLALVLGLILGATSMAFGADGDFLKLGRSNLADSESRLNKSGTGPALSLQVDSGPPLVVNSDTRVRDLNAGQLDGREASELKASCPPGTQLFGGACIETSPRTLGTSLINNSFPNASSDCADEGRRLPTAAELEAFRQQPGITLGGGSTSDEWAAELLDTNTALRMNDSGGYSGGTINGASQGLATYRCVTSPSG